MKTRPIALVLCCLFTGAARADWVLSDYATATPDAETTDKIYGIQTFQNKASTTSATVAGGSVVFKATYASDGTEGYTANVGLLHPLTADWSEHDLMGITGVSFEYKNSAKITDALAISFGSGAYSEALAKAGTVHENTVTGAAALGINTSWRTASLDILDFAPPKWWTPSADFPSKADMLAKVKNIQFAPKTLYTGDGTQNGKACTKCVGPDMTSLTLELRNIMLKSVGPYPWPNPTGIECAAGAPFTQVDNFQDGDVKNLLGGYWYVFSDSGNPAVAADLTDKSKGSSTATMAVDAASGAIGLTASLNKIYGGTWHDYAGWAALGMEFAGGGMLNDSAAKMAAIGFTVMVPAADNAVKTINFKASMKGVPDSVAHQFALPVSQLAVEGGKMACVRTSDLKQPSYVPAAQKVAFDPLKMTKLAWEAKITDQKSSAITTAAASFLVSDVRFYGSDKIFSGTRDRKTKVAGFSVRVGEGSLGLSGYEGIKSFEVVTLDGRKVSSFAPAASVALSLPRGTYFLVGRRDGASLTKSFSVVR